MYDQTSWELVSSDSFGAGISAEGIVSLSATGGKLYVRDGVTRKTHSLKLAYISAGVGLSALPVELTGSLAELPSYGTRVRSGPGAIKPGSLNLNEFKGECLIVSGSINAMVQNGQASLIFFGLPSLMGSNWGFWATAASEVFEATAAMTGVGLAAAPLATALAMCSAVGVLAGMTLTTTPGAAITISRGSVQ